jgi:hypothetical protein
MLPDCDNFYSFCFKGNRFFGRVGQNRAVTQNLICSFFKKIFQKFIHIQDPEQKFFQGTQSLELKRPDSSGGFLFQEEIYFVCVNTWKDCISLFKA